MSIERELLKQVIQDAYEGTMSLSLYNEITDYLAQPEHIENKLEMVEPFAWCIKSKSSADWCFAADKLGVIENAKLLDEDCDRSNPFPLYTSPPTREPLSDEEVMILGVQNLCNEANSFKPFGFARAIEKAHGIGESE